MINKERILLGHINGGYVIWSPYLYEVHIYMPRPHDGVLNLGVFKFNYTWHVVDISSCNIFNKYNIKYNISNILVSSVG